MAVNDTEMRPTRSAITAILAGLLVIALGYASYRYFNKQASPEINGGTNTDTVREFGTNNDMTPKKISETEAMEARKEGIAGAQSVQWLATDYQKDDIKGGSYTVKAGDTLWEIAEARYGDGAQWGKILSANSGDVGFLPNGSQALIVPGQVLVLP